MLSTQSTARAALQIPPPAKLGAAFWLLAWAGASALLLVLKIPTLHEPYFWDAVGCYYPQAREFAYHARQFLSSHPEFVRPPLYSGVMAALMRGVGDTPLVLHCATVIWVALALPAVYGIARTLGATLRIGLLAAALCMVSPLFFAQASLVQTDVPAAALVAVAWLMALRGQLLLYGLFGSLAVLTKESSYYLCLPSAVLVLSRLVVLQRRPLLSISTLLRVVPALVPGFTLALWLLVHRAITGHLMSSAHTAVIGSVSSTLGALSHNFVEGGRALLGLCALLCLIPTVRGLWAAYKTPASAHPFPLSRQLDVVCTGLLWVSLPLCFPGQLIRYMAPSLPALCVLAALGIAQLPPVRRTGAGALLLGALIGMWHGDSWHTNFTHHVEGNLDYRQLLAAHVELAVRMAAQHPRRVLTDFPMLHFLSAPPESGYLAEPLNTSDLDTLRVPTDVCASDFVITSDFSKNAVLDAAIARGYVTPWQIVGGAGLTIGKRPLTPPWARRDLSMHIFRVTCPATP